MIADYEGEDRKVVLFRQMAKKNCMSDGLVNMKYQLLSKDPAIDPAANFRVRNVIFL